MLNYLRQLFSELAYKRNKYHNDFFYRFFQKKLYFVTDINIMKAKSTTTVSVAGYLLDMDNRYYYLGDTKDAITHWVEIDSTKHGECLEVEEQELIAPPITKKTKDKYDLMLDELSGTDKHKVN